MRKKKTDNNKTFIQKHYPLLIILFLIVLSVATIIILKNIQSNKTNDNEDAYVVIPNGPDGYYNPDQIAYGGDSVSNVSINSVNMTSDENVLCISIDFKEENSSSQTSTIMSSVVPIYSVQVLSQPYRLMIHMESVSDWSFTAKKSWLDYTLLQGAFVAPPTNSTNDNPSVVFQLSKNVTYKVQEENGVLRVFLKETETDETPKYYALLNGLTNYASAKSINTTPCLCSDSVHILLISEGFSSPEEAQKYCVENASSISREFPGKSPFIQRIDPGQLPVFPEGLDEDEMATLPILSRYGNTYTLPVFMVNGIVLSTDQTSVLCAVPYIDAEISSIQYAEQLYRYEIQSEEYSPIDELLFHTILMASYSTDRNYIAILDFVNDDNKTDFYIFDIEHGNCSLVEDFQDCFVYDFIWGADNCLYAIIEANDGQTSLQQVSIENNQFHANEIIELASSDGMLASSDDALYYSEKDADETTRIKFIQYSDLQASASTLIEGSRFYIVSNTLFVETANGIDAFDLTTKELLKHLSCESMVSATPLIGSETVVFTISKTKNEELYDVYLYDCSSPSFDYLCSTFCNDFQALSDHEVIINSFFATQNDTVPVAYSFDINLFDFEQK